MHSSFIKSKAYAIIALIILSVSFTFPMISFHGTLNKIHENKVDKIPSLAYKVWNYYNQGMYKSNTTPKFAHNNLENMIKSTSEIGMASLPIWAVSLDAPNYPKDAFPEGIPVYFHFDGFSGEVHEMNTINHYIGMDPMWRGGQIEREVGIYALLLVSMIMIIFIFYNDKVSKLFMLIPISLPLLFIADYAYWLYWFGHNLRDWGAFNIKPFMPTVFGDGKVAQFVTHSYPTIGFYMIVAIGLFSLLSLLTKNKALKATAPKEMDYN